MVMNPQILELIQSFESDAKNQKDKYHQFLVFIYLTFDNRISRIKTDKLKDKYKQMRKSILQYVSVHKKEIIKELR